MSVKTCRTWRGVAKPAPLGVLGVSQHACGRGVAKPAPLGAPEVSDQ
jgi:hypothetical protein